MGYYNVIRPCIVGKLHYATIPSQPIAVDDEIAAPLVESGDLEPYALNAGLPSIVDNVIRTVEGFTDLIESSSEGVLAEAGQQAGEDFTKRAAAIEADNSPKPRRSRRRTEG